MTSYLAITGGVGGAKLALGLARILTSAELAFVVNTGDDFEHFGLHISPDVDTLTYTLSQLANPVLGWGRDDETWSFMETLEELGGDTWFRLGDRDLALHALRTQMLNEGATLTQVTRHLCTSLGIEHAVYPMSDQPVRTTVNTLEGALAFQHYFVREQCRPKVTGIEFKGANAARPNHQLMQWLGAKELEGVIICPSNPFLSVDPILALPGLREALANCQAKVIAVSPVIGGEAVKGPTVKMMQELGVPNSAAWVASHYADFLDGFVLDKVDMELVAEVKAMGMDVLYTNTIMTNLDERIDLARACIEFIGV